MLKRWTRLWRGSALDVQQSAQRGVEDAGVIVVAAGEPLARLVDLVQTHRRRVVVLGKGKSSRLMFERGGQTAAAVNQSG